MKLLTKSIRDRLLSNGRSQQSAMMDGEDTIDFKPVVELFTPMHLVLGC